MKKIFYIIFILAIVLVSACIGQISDESLYKNSSQEGLDERVEKINPETESQQIEDDVPEENIEEEIPEENIEDEIYQEDIYEDVECVIGEDCDYNEICRFNTCEECYGCGGRREGEKCVYYNCCVDGTCSDGIASTIDLCENPGTEESYCVNTPRTDLYPLKVVIVEFAPPDVQYGTLYYCYKDELGYYFQTLEEYCTEVIESYTFLEVFNNPQKQFEFSDLRELDQPDNPYSILYINDYFEKQAETYGFTNFPIFELTLLGPFELDEDPPRRGREDGTMGLEEFFQQKTNDFNLDLSEYDAIAYVHFDDQGITQRDYPGFTSFATEKIIYNSISTDRFDNDGLETILHELTHILGAYDKYIDPCDRGPYMSCCKDPEGIPEPDKDPKYPQEKECLMCGAVALTEEGESQATNIDNIHICETVAEEIGWK